MKWEYKTKRASCCYISEWANDEGKYGWELVSVVPEALNADPKLTVYVLVFKRPL
jgi:hypothetical protein